MKKAHLIIDLGNTKAKLALFTEGKVKKIKTIEGDLTINNMEDFIAGHVLSGAILSSVVHHDPEIEAFLERETAFIRFSHQTKMPLAIDYETPETLGLDRLANAAMLQRLCPNGASLAVDVGTCIKFDLVVDGHYKGGSISPGLFMRAHALHTFTDKLPLMEGADTPNLTGASTFGSLASGVVNGMFHEMNGMIQAYVKQYPGIKIVLTGGDAERFPISSFLSNEGPDSQKNHIFADALFTLKGLESIVDYHENL